MVRVRDVRNDVRLVQIPPDRIENSLRYHWLKPLAGLRKLYVQAGHSYVAKQTRAPANSDFAPPPAAYWLWNASLGTSLSLAKNTLDISLSIQNAFDTSYRDYLNRFRYYADDQGRNVSLRTKFTF